jgi:hypothetical protein
MASRLASCKPLSLRDFHSPRQVAKVFGAYHRAASHSLVSPIKGWKLRRNQIQGSFEQNALGRGEGKCFGNLKSQICNLKSTFALPQRRTEPNGHDDKVAMTLVATVGACKSLSQSNLRLRVDRHDSGDTETPPVFFSKPGETGTS